MKNFDKMIQFNPNFERTKRKFDQNGFKGLLLNNVELDTNIELCLNKGECVKLMKYSGNMEQSFVFQEIKERL